VRANSIFRKLDEAALASARELMSESNDPATSRKQDVARIFEGESGDEIWSLVTLAARLDESLAQSAAMAEPAVLAKYTFNLARAFNLFYHRHRIIVEEDEARRAVLIAAADVARRQLTAALATLGIHVPERM
jgi:arginyl-tRNA synthetase